MNSKDLRVFGDVEKKDLEHIIPAVFGRSIDNITIPSYEERKNYEKYYHKIIDATPTDYILAQNIPDGMFRIYFDSSLRAFLEGSVWAEEFPEKEIDMAGIPDPTRGNCSFGSIDSLKKAIAKRTAKEKGINIMQILKKDDKYFLDMKYFS